MSEYQENPNLRAEKKVISPVRDEDEMSTDNLPKNKVSELINETTENNQGETKQKDEMSPDNSSTNKVSKIINETGNNQSDTKQKDKVSDQRDGLSDCYRYNDKGIMIYTDPTTKKEFKLSADNSKWVPLDESSTFDETSTPTPYEFDGTTYSYVNENKERFRWNLVTKVWEKQQQLEKEINKKSDSESEMESEEDENTTEEEKEKRKYRKRKAQPGWGQQNNYFTGENGVQMYKDPSDGMTYEWDRTKNAWFPKIDEDFMAQYQMNYGFTKDGVAEPTRPEEPKVEPTKEEEALAKKAKVAENAAKQQSAKWFDEDEAKTTKVYVSNLPSTITEEKFIEFMTKCGMIDSDVRTNKPKIKLYKDENGQPKGDALCTYIKVESVQLALTILDGFNLDGSIVKVERAKFEMKGNAYNPKLKPKKLKKKELEMMKKKHQKIFEWQPDQLRGERSKRDKVIVIKNLFDPKEFDLNPTKILEYTQNLREKCSKFGKVRRVVVYDKNVEGVAQVFFDTASEADMAIEMMNKRLFYNGKMMEVFTWDGKTKYKVNETEEEERERLAKWDEFLTSSEEAMAQQQQDQKVDT